MLGQGPRAIPLEEVAVQPFPELILQFPAGQGVKKLEHNVRDSSELMFLEDNINNILDTQLHMRDSFETCFRTLSESPADLAKGLPQRQLRTRGLNILDKQRHPPACQYQSCTEQSSAH